MLKSYTAVVENIFGDKIFVAVKVGEHKIDVMVVDEGGIAPLTFFLLEDYQEFIESLQIKTVTETKEEYLEVA